MGTTDGTVTINTPIPMEVIEAGVQRAADAWWKESKGTLDAEVQRLRDALKKLDASYEKEIDILHERLEKKVKQGLVATGVLIIIGILSAILLATSGSMLKVNESLLALQDRIAAGYESVRKSESELNGARDKVAEVSATLVAKVNELEQAEKRFAAMEQRYASTVQALENRVRSLEQVPAGTKP